MVAEGMRGGKGRKPHLSSLFCSLDHMMLFSAFSHVFPRLEGSTSVYPFSSSCLPGSPQSHSSGQLSLTPQGKSLISQRLTAPGIPFTSDSMNLNIKQAVPSLPANYKIKNIALSCSMLYLQLTPSVWHTAGTQ